MDLPSTSAAAPGARQAPALAAIVWSAQTPARHNLPPQPTRLIGREGEIALVVDLLRRGDVRLLTLTGPGGVGKTRLALAAAEAALDAFPDGIWFVDFAPLADAGLVLPTVAATLGIREDPALEPPGALRAHLDGRSVLLILDNCEHLLSAAPAVDALIAACANLTVLTTSREPLHLRREHIVVVPPLAVAEPPVGIRDSARGVAEIAKSPAVALFVERASAADASFALEPGNADAVSELCRRLDGLPLALELAAARTRLLDPAALAARVEHGLAVLRWDSPDLPPRQRTLRATLDGSLALLSPVEQAVFRRLGVFAGGFTLEAATVVAATNELEADPLEVLQGLVDKHLVSVPRGTGEEARFGHLRTIREYALERLTASGEAEATQDLHLTYYVALAERAERAMWGPDEEVWLDLLGREIDNLRLAHDWAITRGDAEAEGRLVAALALFWLFRGYLREGARRIAAALPRSSELAPALRARLLAAAGLIGHWSDDDGAITHYEESLAAAKAAGDTTLAARVLGQLGTLVYAHGDVARAHALVAEELALARAADDGRLIGYAFIHRVQFAIGPHGSPREREHLLGELEEPVARLRAAEFQRGLAVLLAGRARLLVEVDAPAAAAVLREALVLARELSTDPVIISVVPWIAAVLLAKQLPAEQAARLGAGITTLEARSIELGGRSFIARSSTSQDRAVLEEAVAAAHETLG